MSTGSSNTCALTTAGGVKCWGSNNFGQLGDGQVCGASYCATPVDVSGLTSGVSAVSVGGYGHSCALTTAGGVKCWGYNADGELGDGTISPNVGCHCKPTPVDVYGLTSGVAAVSAGVSSTCAVTTAGGVKCWGGNQDGQLGDGQACGAINCATPVEVIGLGSGVAAISAWSLQACAVTKAAGLKCWGNNGNGQLGDGQACGAICTTPVDVTGLSSGVAAVSVGYNHTCARTTAGGVKCWGYDGYGQLGDGGFCGLFYPYACTTPIDVSGLTSGVAAVSAGAHHTCALTTPGGLECWGENTDAQLGDGASTGPETCFPGGVARPCSTIPIAVSGLTSGVAAVSAAVNYACARTTAGGPKCWGSNICGQLGDGTTTDSSTPVDVVGLGP